MIHIKLTFSSVHNLLSFFHQVKQLS